MKLNDAMIYRGKDKTVIYDKELKGKYYKFILIFD